MIVTRKIALRIALIVAVAVILQVSFLSYVSIFGAAPHLLPVLVVVLGLLGGSMVGAVCGFATGLLIDSVLLQTLGVSSLILLSVGYLAGRYREGFEISNSLIPPLLAGALTLLAGVGFSALQLMLGVETPVSLLVLREIVLQALLAILLAAPLYPFVRWTLRPALIEDAPPRRFLASGSSRSRARRRARDRRPSRPARATPRGAGA